MPFHHFGPHFHFTPLVLTGALAAAAYVFYVGKDRAMASAGALRQRAAEGIRGWGEASPASATVCKSGRTGNSSFDDYRAATLKDLEKEAAEFRAYLEGLRRTGDKAEFDDFLKTRSDRSSAT